MALLEAGKLYVVATPIGNLEDISSRALRLLGESDIIAAEDTRHTAKLCRHYGIDARFISLHNYNEHERVAVLLDHLQQGESIALVSDAGTPLISDPGYLLVKAARAQGFDVVPVPGPCAFLAALSVAGLPSNRIVFEGFLPSKKGARRARLEGLKAERGTMIFYESPHRVKDFLQDAEQAFGERKVVVARELTKTFETVLSGTALDIVQLMEKDPQQLKGEFVVLIEGSLGVSEEERSIDIDKLLSVLLVELPLKKAASISSQVSQYSKKQLYARGLQLKERGS